MNSAQYTTSVHTMDGHANPPPPLPPLLPIHHVRTYYATTFPWALLTKRMGLDHTREVSVIVVPDGFDRPHSRQQKKYQSKPLSQFPWSRSYSFDDIPHALREKRILRIDWGPSSRLGSDHPPNHFQAVMLGRQIESQVHFSSNDVFVENYVRFDIDLNEFTSIRDRCGCGSLKMCCELCWLLAKSAMRVLEYLCKRFGLNDYMFVFSGGRGVHCWVFTTDCHIRRSLIHAVQSISSLRGFSTETGRFVNTEKNTIYDSCIVPYYDQFITESRNHHHHGTTRYNDGCSSSSQSMEMDENVEHSFETIANDFAIKIDEPVSNNVRHLLKSPFCIHLETGYVCVPIPLSDIDHFSIANVPRLSLNTPLDKFLKDVRRWFPLLITDHPSDGPSR